MIVLPDGRVGLLTILHSEKRTVDSPSGNPTTRVVIEMFASMSDQINNNTGDQVIYNVSMFTDTTMNPKSYNEIEKWLIQNDPDFKGGWYVQ